MAKYKNILKFCLVFALAMFLIPMQNIFAQSNKTIKDGVVIILATDKDDYKADEIANITVSLNNTNDYPVHLENLKLNLPETLSLQDKALSDITLGEGESKTLSLKAKVLAENKKSESEETKEETKSTDEVNNSVKTGENSNMAVILVMSALAVLSAVVLLIAMKNKKKTTKLMSILLGIALCLPVTMGNGNINQAKDTLHNGQSDESGEVSLGVNLNEKASTLSLGFELYHPRISSLEMNGENTLVVNIKSLPKDWKGKVTVENIQGVEVASKDVKSSDTSVSFDGLTLSNEHWVKLFNSDGTLSNEDVFNNSVYHMKQKIAGKFSASKIREDYVPGKYADFTGTVYGNQTHSIVHSFYIEGVGHYSTWVMPGLMSAVMLTPIEKDAPLFCDDRMDMPGVRMLLLELYRDPNNKSTSSELEALRGVIAKYNKPEQGVIDISGQQLTGKAYEQWLVPNGYLFSMIPEESKRLQVEQEYFDKYLDLVAASPAIAEATKRAEMQKYVDVLLGDPGGPTQSLIGLLGQDSVREFFEYYYFGTKPIA